MTALHTAYCKYLGLLQNRKSEINVNKVYYSAAGQYTFIIYLIISVLRYRNKRPHRRRRVQQLCYCCVCIRCSADIFIEPLPTNIGGLQMGHTD
jgi:hypothetical protein